MAKRRKPRIRLAVNKTGHVPLVKDFNTFITYLVENKPCLTKRKQFLSPKDLHQINQLMSNPNRESTSRTNQELYPLFHLFYHLIFYGNLFEKVSVGSQKVKIQKTDRMEEYLALTSTEKYFFLLETFWVDCDWNKLASEHRAESTIWQVMNTMEFIVKRSPGKTIFLDKKSSLYFENFFMLYLSFFGFFKITRNEELYKEYFSRSYPSSISFSSSHSITRFSSLLSWNLNHSSLFSG